MRRVIRFAKGNKLLIAATALLMVGAGCVSAVRTTRSQLTEDALKPITVPLEAYDRAVETASGSQATDREAWRQSGIE